MTHDEKLGRWLKWAAVFALLFFIFLAAVDARELAEIVEPSELSSEWDGRRVMISGYAYECELLQGRRGSIYTKCVVDGIDVYMVFPVWGVVGEPVIVIGEYMSHGRFGGFEPGKPFIIADTFIRDWDN